MENEKRKYPRCWRGRIKVTGFKLLSHKMPAVCKNISASGVLLETMVPLKAGEVLHLDITLLGLKRFTQEHGGDAAVTGDQFSVSGIVVWMAELPNKNRNVGVNFQNLPEEFVKVLDSFICHNMGLSPVALPKA